MTPSELNVLADGCAIGAPLYETLRPGFRLATNEGGQLAVVARATDNDELNPESVWITVIGSIVPVERPHAEYGPILRLTTALADSDGQMWQRTRALTVTDLWERVRAEGLLYEYFNPPADHPAFRNAVRVTRRMLVPPVQTLWDGRDPRLVEVVRHTPSSEAAAPSGHETYTKLLFRFTFKYFGADMGIVEDRAIYRRHDGVESEALELVLTLKVMSDADSIATIGPRDRIVSTDPRSLYSQPKLCLRRLSLDPGWTDPAWGPAIRADREAWERAFREVDLDPAQQRGFRPNERVRYQQS